MSIDVMNMMKQFLLLLAALLALPLCAASAGNPRELAQRAFPHASQWTETSLSPGLVLLRGSMAAASSTRTMHMYLGVQTDAGKPRLVLTHGIAAASDQYARFEVKGKEIRAYHANGTLLARLRMWGARPAEYAAAPSLVSLRLVGVERGFLIAEAENLTDFPVTLRRGRVYLLVYDGHEVERSNLCVHSEACRLLPRQSLRMKLRISSHLPLCPTGLLKKKRVDLVYRANDDQPCGADISPAWVLQPGMPQLGDLGYSHPIRLRDDFAVVCESGMGGYTMHRLVMYQLSKGVWVHTGYLNTPGDCAPYAFEIEHDKIRVLDCRGRMAGGIVYPGGDDFKQSPQKCRE